MMRLFTCWRETETIHLSFTIKTCL